MDFKIIALAHGPLVGIQYMPKEHEDDWNEYDLKDELVRQTIMDTQDDVDEIKDKLDKIDQRLYELQQR